MNNNLIICIGRQFGSGGREIGQKLAQKLGIAYYDKQILTKASADHGIVRELFEKADEQPTDSFLYSLSLNGGQNAAGMLGFSDYLTNDNLFAMMSKTITDIAAEGPCVIIGRCADYILQDLPNCYSVFIGADQKTCTKRIMELRGIDEKAAASICRKTDKKRASYYYFYTEKSWGACASYDISLNSSRLGIDGTVNVLETYFRTIGVAK